jgi:hypothetical protein
VFTSTRPTVEGDPIVWHIELSSDHIEVSIDNTADKFAAQDARGVVTIMCINMSVTSEGQNDFAFGLTGCDGEFGDMLVVWRAGWQASRARFEHEPPRT